MARLMLIVWGAAMLSVGGAPVATGTSSVAAVETGRGAVRGGVSTVVDSRVATEAQAEGLNLDTREPRGMVLLFR